MSRPNTESEIMKSFVKLLNQAPLDKITVKALVSDCGISRNTFYYHYQDIPDLLRATLSAVMEAVGRENPAAWQESLGACTRFALENPRAVYHIYRSAHRDLLVRCLHQLTGDSMEKLVRHLAEGLAVSDEDIALLVRFYRHAVVGTLLEWLEKDMKPDVTRMISRLGILLEGSLRQCLERIGKAPQFTNRGGS